MADHEKGGVARSGDKPLSPTSPGNSLDLAKREENQLAGKQRHKEFIQERMRQAKWSYNLAVIFLAASSVPFLIGITLMAVGQLNSGVTSTAGGVGSSLLCSRWLKVAREANDRLDRLSQEFDDDDSV